MRNALIVLGIALVFTVGCWRPAGPTTPSGAVKKVWDREAFKNAVIGLTTDEVKAALGTPDKTSETGSAKAWYYHGITQDAATGKVDYATVLWFQNGQKVSSVDF